ncbi:hypothetical protein [Granulosicoccus sp. 3-233]|uniref:hypothetical protein n=1 Tax=Granulosicoccus sp. 3-233 TaxID=3417969 RepID=UPI003D342597
MILHSGNPVNPGGNATPLFAVGGWDGASPVLQQADVPLLPDPVAIDGVDLHATFGALAGTMNSLTDKLSSMEGDWRAVGIGNGLSR